MFGFGSKKPASSARPTKPSRPEGAKSRNLAQFGLLDVGLVDTGLPEDDDDDDDMDLEAELAALTRGNAPPRKKPQKPVVSAQELDAMISSSLKDIPSDAEVSDVDDDEVEDELNELCGGSDEESPEPEEEKKPPTVSMQEQLKCLQERLLMYQQAEKTSKAGGDAMKSRRYGRGVKTLQDMLKQIQSGSAINMEDVPPPLAQSTQHINVPAPALKHPAALEPVSSEPEAPPVPPHAPSVENPPEPSLIAEAPRELPPVPNRVPLPTRNAPPIPSRPSLDPVLVPTPAPILPPKREDPQQSEAVVSPNVALAVSRRNELKQAALEAKRAGDQATALQFVRQVKVCDQLIAAAQQGSEVDWSLLPQLSVNATVEPIVKPKMPETEPVATVVQEAPVPAGATESEAAAAQPVPDAPPKPRSTMEALEQRLAKYQSSMEQAQGENNSSKARRLGRIVKQYQDAIKCHKAGRPIPFDELPTPPGYPPIPGAPLQPDNDDSGAPEPAAIPAPVNAPALPQPSLAAPAAVSPPTSNVAAAGAVKKTALSTRQDKQLAMLIERQTLFKQAALEAKKTGELSQAKEYLRMAKGLDPLIDANKCGVPVDMDTLPIPPQMKQRATQSSSKGESKNDMEGFEILSGEECALAPALSGQEKSALLVQLEADLVAQLKICADNRDHYKLMGDVANANRFDQLALHTRKDLGVVRGMAVRGDTVPRWKNEMKTFSIVKCCTDLKDDDMEVTVIRGLSYNVPNPKTIDTYVRYEIPIPNSDTPSKDRTNTVRDTNSPEYNQSFHVNISRQSRTILRIFKGKTAKFEVWSKGGFLRSDTLLGTATVKLADLLNHCVLHEAVDLMDGRKVVGGKLEVKIRIRDPIVGKEVEQVQEKWTTLIH